MILMNEFKEEPQGLRDASLNAAKRVIDSGWYILGQELLNFEKQWAQACGLEFGIGVGNGMDAIEISLRALNIGPGDEVITTSMTAFATVLAIIRSGATPVLGDIEPDSGLLSIESTRRIISSRTKAIILVHLYGQVRDIDKWQALCSTLGIHLIEDCAQSHLATWRGVVAGGFGEVGAYSFYPTKNLGAIGDAGMLVTNNKRICDIAMQLRNYGQSVRYHHPEIGMNSRLDELHAAILSARMEWLIQFTVRRREIALAYRLGIRNSLIKQLAQPQEPSAHVYHLYVVLCKERDLLQAHLTNCGVQSLIHYPVPVHHQAALKTVKRDPKGLITSENHAKNCLSLPCHPQMSNSEVDEVIKSINDFR
jgi:dTDP-4-amino-4,6-dideoxygalactose transaminase